MAPSIISATIQSAVLKAASSFCAQLLSQCKRDSGTMTIDIQRIVLFAIFGIVSAPLISWWQQVLEELFPTYASTDEATKTVRGSEPNEKTTQQWTISTSNATKWANISNWGSSRKIKWYNVAIKLVLDQTIGQIVVNTTFVIIMRYQQWESATLLLRDIQSSVWTIVRASWKLWPWVALVNFLFVPPSSRVVLVSIIGFGWNIFLSFLSSGM
ncbi:hypothetical protein V1525DRAFT_19685 [Lipomyces kononenkoae]|uniref:Uncharacterized protein n=1 Tax=Lipomyces kononenkoae TaxID=34357 RepID=A0ACC3STT7_LIPKO